MLITYWICIFIIIGLKFNSVITEIKINTKYNSAYQLSLTCEVHDKDAHKYSVFLICPGRTDDFCYSNCSSLCSQNCAQLITGCKHNLVALNYSRNIWNIDMRFIKNTGRWQCKFKGRSSKFVELAKSVDDSNSLQKSTTQPTLPISDQSTLVKLDRFTSTTVKPKQSSKEISFNNQPSLVKGFINFWNFLKHPNVVLILFFCIIISVLINIVFFIRCYLVKLYLDKHQFNQDKSSDSERSSCLQRFCCMNFTKPYQNTTQSISINHRSMSRPPSLIKPSHIPSSSSYHNNGSGSGQGADSNKEDTYEPGMSIGSHQINRSLLQGSLSQYELLPADQYNSSSCYSIGVGGKFNQLQLQQPQSQSLLASSGIGPDLLMKKSICCHGQVPLDNYVVVVENNNSNNGTTLKQQQQSRGSQNNCTHHNHHNNIPCNSSDYSSWSVLSQDQIYNRTTMTGCNEPLLSANNGMHLQQHHRLSLANQPSGNSQHSSNSIEDEQHALYTGKHSDNQSSNLVIYSVPNKNLKSQNQHSPPLPTPPPILPRRIQEDV